MRTVETPLFAQSLIHESRELEEYWFLFVVFSFVYLFCSLIAKALIMH